VLPPTPEGAAAGADYRVRIFCPGRELPFAGHPTLGTCHAWLQAGGQSRQPSTVVQECGVGLVTIRRQPAADGAIGRLAFAAPPLLRSGPLDEAEVAQIARGLGVTRSDIVQHAWCDNGPGWRGVMLASAEQVLALKPDAAVLGELAFLGLVAPQAKVGVVGARTGGADGVDGADTQFEVRAFFPGHGGIAEDPVTGSLNAALGQWLIGAGLAPGRYVAAQGTVLGRRGRVHVERDASGTVWVGGDSVACVRGQVTL
jgi:PhzF family phenazine biosynthesis protein